MCRSLDEVWPWLQDVLVCQGDHLVKGWWLRRVAVDIIGGMVAGCGWGVGAQMSSRGSKYQSEHAPLGSFQRGQHVLRHGPRHATVENARGDGPAEQFESGFEGVVLARELVSEHVKLAQNTQ